MAVILPISELINSITERIYENHERAISGPDLQEMLIDIVDTLQAYTDAAVIEPAENYYVDEIQINEVAKTITLVRAGGILPTNISASLAPLDETREGVEEVTDGDNPIVFAPPLPAGFEYELLFSVIDAEGFDIGGTESNLTNLGFDINVPDDGTLTYETIKKT